MFQKLLEAIASGLNKRKIDYMIIGGQALLVYGEPRLTKDIDLTLGIGPERLAEIEHLIAENGWKILVDSTENFVKRSMVLPCLDPLSGIRIDFIFSFSPYETQALKRANKIVIGKSKVCFATVEDFIIHKMIAGRPRDLEDIRIVLLKNPSMNFDYIQQWLKQFEQALSQPFLKKSEYNTSSTPHTNWSHSLSRSTSASKTSLDEEFFKNSREARGRLLHIFKSLEAKIFMPLSGSGLWEVGILSVIRN